MKPLRILIALILTAGFAFSQAKPEFEVASVKPGTGGRISTRGGPGTPDPGRIAFENIDLKRLLMKAYGVEADQISGPGWLDSEKYTIIAKLPVETTKEQFQTMLQALLAERFKLTLHHELKEFSAYELTIAKSGPKLTPAAARDPNDTEPDHPPDGTPASMTVDKEGCPITRPGVQSGSGRFGPGVNCTRFSKTSISEMANLFESFLAMEDGTFGTPGKPHIIDRTGLTGDFDVTLKFHLVVRFPGQPANPDDMEGPNLATALEQQLGLKLQKAKTTLDVIVIDHADKVPTDN